MIRTEKSGNGNFIYLQIKEISRIMDESLKILQQILKQRKPDISVYIADILIKKFFPFIYREKLYIYEDGFYYKVTNDELLRKIRDTLGEDADRIKFKWQKTAIEIVEVRCEEVKDLPKYKEFLNLQNGIYDVEQNKMIEHSPDYKMVYKISINYNPDAKGDEFKKFINSINAYKEHFVEHIQEVFGYSISDYPLLKEFIILYGESNTGKSVFLSLIRKIIGNEFVSGVDITHLNDERYLASMCSKKLNICSDIGCTKIKDLSVLKQITSADDAIQVRHVYKDSEMVTERPKILFASNSYPQINAQGYDLEAFCKRLHIIPFSKKIPENSQIADFGEKLFQAECEYILLWAINGYRRFLANGGKFTHSNAVQKSTWDFCNHYMLPNEFVKNCVEFKSGKKVFTQDLRKALKDYCYYMNTLYYEYYLGIVRKILTAKDVPNKKLI